MSTQSDAFITKYRPAAEKIAAETGVPVARILAQAGFETGWNTDAPGNNLFGVKAQPGYDGKSQTLDTKEADANGNLVATKQPFRVYDSPEDSFRDWSKVLQQNNFKAALDPNLSDAQYAQALQAGGYGTDPNYAAKLHGAITTTREGLGQAPDGSTVALAQAPTQNVSTPADPAMQQPDTTLADAAKAAMSASPITGLLAQSVQQQKQQSQQQQTAGLLAAGAPTNVPTLQAPNVPMGLLSPYKPKVQASLASILKQNQGLLG